jgi:hypothetical protein
MAKEPTREFSKRVMSSPGCAPLRQMLEQVRKSRWSRWAQAEETFLKAMWEFEGNFISGRANQGDNQNGKGDSFTDLIGLLLERCSGKALAYRGGVHGLVFPNHALDATYPKTGTVEVLIETKAAGAPKTGRNVGQKNPLGRRGSADLDKRVKEAALKVIDLKAEWSRIEGKGGGPSGDFLTWLKRSKPSCYLLMAIRVVDENDLKQTIRFGEAACQLMDACGVVAFMPTPSGYLLKKVPTLMEMDRVLSRICDQLRQLP